MAYTDLEKKKFDQRIYNQVINMGYSDLLGKLIVSQARYETGEYTNNAFKYNNAFGYKFVDPNGSKLQTGRANKSSEYGVDGSAYGAYKNIEDSTKEVILWMQRREKEGKFKIANIKNETDFANALKSGGYYGITAASYAKGIAAKLKNVSVTAVAGIGGLILLAVFFF